ncbi:hypothetical protein GMST_43280 [Geomonas silvestris]|uniref:Uncharacterized protein n=1 Tax=Geomonas silvestris TaxID=2740184 RepID=A0A6V8MQK6_9BACT|nr:hypothetical protein GMST_43280 [Geomonas silvestris]
METSERFKILFEALPPIEVTTTTVYQECEAISRLRAIVEGVMAPTSTTTYST